MRICSLVSGLVFGAFALAGSAVAGEDAAPVALPKPVETFAADLMDALRGRQSTREFADKDVDLQTLANLLWAADGVNRPDIKKRTAPFATGINPVNVYVLKADGSFRYDVDAHALVPVGTRDLRPIIGMQPFVASAPVVFLFAYDSTKGNPKSDDRQNEIWAWNGLGAIQQNLSLACAAQKMGGVVVASVKKDVAKAELNLAETETALTIQPVGFLK